MSDALKPVFYDDDTLFAMRALHEGVANAGQQKMVLSWLIRDVTKYHDLSFRPGQDGRRETDFMEGRRFCGATIVKMLQPEVLPPAKPKKEVKDDDNS